MKTTHLQMLISCFCLAGLMALGASACGQSSVAMGNAMTVRSAEAAGPVQMISGNNPPLPDPLANAGDPNDTGISATQYPECMYCSPQPYNPNTIATCPAVVGQPQECQGYCHVPDNELSPFSTNPPTSGNHSPDPEHVLGEHVTPVGRGHYVHSMEHGAVVLTYNCPQGCRAELDVVRQAVQMRAGQKVILTPDPLLKGTRFAAVSWTWLYAFDQPDLNTLLCFIDQHELYGRECVNRVCLGLHAGPPSLAH